MTDWMAGKMEWILDFSNILNASIAASWLVLAVVILRFLLKKAPKWTHVALWGLVAVRLLLPFSIESAFSLIPSAETVPKEILRFEGAQLQEPAYLDVVSNPVFSGGATVEIGQTVDRVQMHMVNLSFIWLAGIAVLLLYTAVSYCFLRHRVAVAIRIRDNVFQSEGVDSPFVLGLMRAKIYVPYQMKEQNLEHVVAHEQAHIKRRDHWWKPMGFLLLTVHWFNPLMWLAYILLCRDIELACDEKVIKELGNEQRADYTQALLSCSVNRRMISACPLAFGEVGVKDRVKSVMNYKKPAFWIVVLAVIACVVVGVCFLTDPSDDSDNTMPLFGMSYEVREVIYKNDSVVESGLYDTVDPLKIQEILLDEGGSFFILEDGNTSVNTIGILEEVTLTRQNFDKYFDYEDLPSKLRRHSDSAWLCIHTHDELGPLMYYVLETPEGEKFLACGWWDSEGLTDPHSDDSSFYWVVTLEEGIPVIDVQQTNLSVKKWFDYLDSPDEMKWDGRLEINIPAFPDVTFRWYPEKIEAATKDEIIPLYTGMPIWNTYFCDLTGDGLPELCSTLAIGSGIIDSRIIVYDYADGASYELSDRMNYDYSLRLNEADGQLYVDKRSWLGGGLLSSGRLAFEDNCIRVLADEKSTDSIANIVDPTKAENFSYDTAVEKFFEDEDNEYYFGGIYSEYVIVHYLDGTQEDIVSALNAGRAAIADLDRFGVRFWAEPKTASGTTVDAGFYLTVGADGVASIEIASPDASGGCQNADGSLFKKGEQIWLEPLSGVADLRGVEITAMNEAGEIIWSASIPDGDENRGFTHLVQDGWTITDLPLSSG